MNQTKASDWISVGALADGFRPENFGLISAPALTGRALMLHLSTGESLSYTFLEDGAISVSGRNGALRHETCRVTSIREGIYFVDHLDLTKPGATISVVLDFTQGTCLVVFGQLPDAADASLSMLERIRKKLPLTAVTADFISGTIDRPYEKSVLPHETDELVGMRVRYSYSPTEQYEHIYLSTEYYTWRCLKGLEKGLCDTDAARYWKIGHSLYLFTWMEKLVPTIGIVLLDLSQKRTDGKIFGYEGFDFSKTCNFQMGAVAQIVSITQRDDA